MRKDIHPSDRLKHELDNTLDAIETQLARLEILSAAITAFSQPVPDYHFSFQHQRHLTAKATLLGGRASV